MRAIILTACVFALLTVAAKPQTTSDEITPEEYIEANEFAHKFEDQLVKTKDITPLIHRYFVKDFDHRWGDELPYMMIRPANIRGANRKNIRRLYIAATNMMSLLVLYTNSRVNRKACEKEIDKCFPGNVRQVFKNDPKWWKAVSENDEEYYPNKTWSDREANEFFWKTLRNFERIAPMLRNAVNQLARGRSDWRLEFSEIENYLHTYRPWLNLCDSRCFGLPKNTRVIRVTVPYFLLELTKIDGQFKVLNFEFAVD